MFPTWRLARNQPGYLAFFWLFFRGVLLNSIKVSLNSQLDSTPLYSSSIFRTLLCFLVRTRFYSCIRSFSSILIFKTRIRSTHKNEKWIKQKNSRFSKYRLYYYRYIFVLMQIVHRLFARKMNNNIIYIRIFWQILAKNSCISPHTESYMTHL